MKGQWLEVLALGLTAGLLVYCVILIVVLLS